jgi:hypothetical protein
VIPALRLLCVLCFLCGLSSCGYEIGPPHAIRDVRVEIFDNVSERRTHEFDLTHAVMREMAAKGLRVNSSDARHTLTGRITDIRTPSQVEGKDDVVLVGSLLFRVEVALTGPDGKAVWKDARAEAVPLIPGRGETFESARREVFDRLARWVVTRFEKE